MINQSAIITEEIKKKFGLSELTGYPRRVAEAILPVVNVAGTPRQKIKIAYATVSDATTGTIITTSTTKKTFITGYQLSYAKDVNNTGIFCGINIYPSDGTLNYLARLRFEPLTAGSSTVQHNFTEPIELSKGSDVLVVNHTNVASVDVTGIIYYYEEENVGD